MQTPAPVSTQHSVNSFSIAFLNQWEVPALLPGLRILMNIRRKQAAKSSFTSLVPTHAGGNLLLTLLLLLQKVIGLCSGFSPSESVRKREDGTYISSCPHLQAGSFEVEGKDITVVLHPYRFWVEVGKAAEFFLNHRSSWTPTRLKLPWKLNSHLYRQHSYVQGRGMAETPLHSLFWRERWNSLWSGASELSAIHFHPFLPFHLILAEDVDFCSPVNKTIMYFLQLMEFRVALITFQVSKAQSSTWQPLLLYSPH